MSNGQKNEENSFGQRLAALHFWNALFVTLLALSGLVDGKPIPNDLGGPVRLIIPQMYAYKSVKWLNRIELIEEDHIGY